MKKKTTRMTLGRKVISRLNAATISGGAQKATQSDQALTGCHTNCGSKDCGISQRY